MFNKATRELQQPGAGVGLVWGRGGGSEEAVPSLANCTRVPCRGASRPLSLLKTAAATGQWDTSLWVP